MTTCKYNLNPHCVLNGTLKIRIIFFYQHVVPSGTNIYRYEKLFLYTLHPTPYTLKSIV
ncbi:MAG: hypothetical protein LBP59_15585 [Planctomycetaceae bacterium]|nr:hypothetical protein [Planctomycetaceae bacterium]